MGSEATHGRRSRGLRARVAVAAAGLGGCGAAAAGWPEPRPLVLTALLAAGLAAWGGRALARLAAPRPPPVADPGFGLPADLSACRNELLALQARIEHAPVALWRASAAAVEPLNVAARRMLAPGGAVDRGRFGTELAALRPGERRLLGYDSERGHERVLVTCAPVAVAGDGARMLALMPVESELETETLVAWQQLVHVLTHEIMNSLTPIASLSRTAHELWAEAAAAPGPASEDLGTALEAIARRAAHLVGFVESYRSIGRWPAPALAPTSVHAVLASVQRLVAGGWTARGGSVHFEVEPPTLELVADAAQLEQVLINLAKNAAEATATTAQPRLEVSARLVRGSRLAIEVADNGPGVPDGLQARIFTPFFTTREQGSGIGLAVVRHLVHGMGGTVRYAKRASGGACFVLTF